jgi:hypothetical protein
MPLGSRIGRGIQPVALLCQVEKIAGEAKSDSQVERTTCSSGSSTNELTVGPVLGVVVTRVGRVVGSL